jgi:two-component system alkaline phosphatase synthesis response regulator PhoP
MKKILIVDDDKDFLFGLRSMLKRKGFKTLTIESGTSVVSLAKIYHPDVILLDMRLPDVDGRSVCKRLKQDAATKKMPVIIISADESIFGLNNCPEADALLEKPFTAISLYSKIAAVTGQS